MEANLCDINHLDADVLLPPRKRLLAGLKKQNSDGNSPMPSTSSITNEFDNRLNNMLRSRLNNPNLSPEEIVDASRSAAEAAVKVAGAARAAAEEKAAIAAKAVAAAKSALELVATVTEETAFKESYLKKNKMKKHVPVQMLYNKHKGVGNSKTDEELARKLHRDMNSSPRISKNSSSSDLKSRKHKRLKRSSSIEKTRVYNGGVVWDGNPPPTSNGNGIAGEVDSEGSIQDTEIVRVDEKISKFNKADPSKLVNGAEISQLKKKVGEALDDTCSIGIKRGRMKQKKLPLSICNFRDQANPKEELKSKSSSLIEENKRKSAMGNKPLFSAGPSGNGVIPVERTSIWKCQAFKAPPACVKQNKVMRS